MEYGYWIKTKPAYSKLSWVKNASRHIVMAEGAGGLAVIRMYQERPPEQPVSVHYVMAEQDRHYAQAIIKVMQVESLHIHTSVDEAITLLASTLSAAYMGVRLYLAGSEHMMWQAAKTAYAHGLSYPEMMLEQAGTLARPVYCVHCKTITPHATANVVACDGCGKMLFVRDHFSQHLGAYMGFMIDAENPGELPEIAQVYP